ncbi:hypothetical protein QZH41_001013 [Actinostola sp. cb2023]|nr:hypothetical protein QZH41_002409 [Actinostola sp. cb2023]KAK3738548.1 hypothetical protein QZH41_001013 [Actinostola sp. cb2023]
MKHLRDIIDSVRLKQDDMESPPKNETKASESRDVGLSSIMEELDKFLAHKNAFTSLLKKIEHTTRISSRVQVLAVVVVVLLYLVEGYAAALLCNILSLLLPMCASINAIENPAFESDTKWLMYWVIFSCVNFLQMFISWMPSYNILKFLFLVWCMAPGRFNGSGFMYFKVVRPFFLKHRECVNGVISDAAKRVCQVAEKTVDEFMIARASKLMQGTENSFCHDAESLDGEKKDE